MSELSYHSDIDNVSRKGDWFVNHICVIISSG